MKFSKKLHFLKNAFRFEARYKKIMRFTHKIENFVFLNCCNVTLLQIEIIIKFQALAWPTCDSLRPRYHPRKPSKRRLAQVIKILPWYKAAWDDITRTKFSIARPESILNRNNFKLILLTLLFNSLLFKINLNCRHALLLNLHLVTEN